MDGGRFDGEIVRIVFLFQLGLRVGFDLNQAPSGQPVSAVSLDPDLLTDGIRYVVERYDGAGSKSGPLAVHDMIILELRITHADNDVEIAEMCGVVAGECAEAGADDLGVLLRYRVSHVVRRRIGFLFQNGKISLQLVVEDVKKGGRRRGREGEGHDQKRDEAHEALG